MAEPLQNYPPERRALTHRSLIPIVALAFVIGVAATLWFTSGWWTSQPVNVIASAPVNAQKLPVNEELANDLLALAPALLSAPPSMPATDKVSFYAARLLYVRAADAPSEIAISRVEQASQLARRGDFAGAVAAVDTMPGREAAAQWRAHALAAAHAVNGP